MSAIENFFASSSIGGWDLLVAALVLVAGWIASAYASRATQGLLRKWSGVTAQTANLAGRLVRYSLLLLAIGITLTVLGASLQPILAAAIIVGVVAFLALRGIAGNFGAGLVIQARRPVKIGDLIAVDGFSGQVDELNGRAVILSAVDGSRIHVPNASILDKTVVNLSEGGRHRSEVEVRIEHGPDFDEARRALVHAVSSAPGVLTTAGIDGNFVVITEVSTTIRLRFWHRADRSLEVRSEVLAAVAGWAGNAGNRFTARWLPADVAVVTSRSE